MATIAIVTEADRCWVSAEPEVNVPANSIRADQLAGIGGPRPPIAIDQDYDAVLHTLARILQ